MDCFCLRNGYSACGRLHHVITMFFVGGSANARFGLRTTRFAPCSRRLIIKIWKFTISIFLEEKSIFLEEKSIFLENDNIFSIEKFYIFQTILCKSDVVHYQCIEMMVKSKRAMVKSKRAMVKSKRAMVKSKRKIEIVNF